MKTYYNVLLSAHSEKNAKEIVLGLVKKKLIPGARITVGPATYWWKGKLIENDDYWNMTSQTEERNLEEIKDEVRKLSDEEVPMIFFTKINKANKEFIEWIEENIE